METADINSALKSLRDKIADQPEKAMAKHVPATARIENGLKCLVEGTRGELIETDMPNAMGGNGSAPNPGWVFRASLASCCATVIAMQAAQQGIELTTLEVTVESDGDLRGILGLDDTITAGMSSLKTNVRIGADNATPEQLREIVEWGSAHAPVGCTVQNAPGNATVIDIV